MYRKYPPGLLRHKPDMKTRAFHLHACICVLSAVINPPTSDAANQVPLCYPVCLMVCHKWHLFSGLCLKYSGRYIGLYAGPSDIIKNKNIKEVGNWL